MTTPAPNKTLLDTDIFSEVLKAKDPQVVARASAYHAHFGHYTIASVTVMEVVKGLHKLQQPDRLTQFLSRLSAIEVLGLDTAAAELAGRIYADLERTGQTIGRADPMIAAIALQNGLVLATGNFEHYQRIQALGYALRIDN
jgi:tRNA(fMet)-specific endonuclease VapC